MEIWKISMQISPVSSHHAITECRGGVGWGVGRQEDNCTASPTCRLEIIKFKTEICSLSIVIDQG